jgi:hypothetical protein
MSMSRPISPPRRLALVVAKIARRMAQQCPSSVELSHGNTLEGQTSTSPRKASGHV